RDDLAQQMQPWQLEEAKKMAAAWPQPREQSYADAGNGNPQFQSEELPPATNYRGPMARQQIADLQWQLAVHGYDPGASDGSVGPRTQGAIQQYQADAGLPVDGQPSPELLEHLQYTDPPVLNRHTAQAQGQPNYSYPSTGPNSSNGGQPYDNGDGYDQQGPGYGQQGPGYGQQGPGYGYGEQQPGYAQQEPPQSAPEIGAAPSLMQIC